MPSPGLFAFMGVLLVLFAGFLVYPLCYVVAKAYAGAEGILGPVRLVLDNAVFRDSIMNGLLIAVATTVLTTALSLPLAFIMGRYRFPGKAWLSGLLLVPMIMPPFVAAIGMKRLLAVRGGALNSLLVSLGVLSETNPIDWLGSGFWGVVVLQTLHLYPIMYLNVAAALANIDPSLEEAARNLGDKGFHLFRRVTLPLLAPGYFAGAAIVFIWSFTDLGTPLIFEYDTVVAVQIFRNLNTQNPAAYSLVLVVLVLSGVVFAGSKGLFGGGVEMMTRGWSAASERRPSARGAAVIYLLLGGVIALALVPHFSVMLNSVAGRWSGTALPESYTFAYFKRVLSSDYTLSSIKNSFLYSASSTVIDVVLGVSIAYVLARTAVRGRALLDLMAMAPLAVPGIVIAFGYVRAFSGGLIDPQNNPTTLLIISYAVRRLPYMVRACYAGLQQTSVALEEASLNLGATPLRTMRKITLPLIAGNIIAGATLCFSFAMLEVSDSLILAMKKDYYPITKRIFAMQKELAEGVYTSSAMGVLGMILLAVSLLLAARLLGRKMGTMFRL